MCMKEDALLMYHRKSSILTYKKKILKKKCEVIKQFFIYSVLLLYIFK